ncbi:MAG: tetratricopeptide repeat protein [Hyphomicrobiales bacterium]|nr:tetratricopeptide repeat protein [Hyphomicrobiales bacterium]
MTILHDASGAETTIASPVALGHWNETIGHVLAHGAAAPVCLGKALAADPSFALGHAAKGLMMLTLARRELTADAMAALATARTPDMATPVTPRERCYTAALSLWLDRRPDLAALELERAISLDNGDVLAAKLVHAILFMSGDSKGMLASARKHLQLYGTDRLHSGYLMGCLAFAHEENGDYGLAESLGLAAIDRMPQDAWARHSVAHVFEMTGRAAEGARWLAQGRSNWVHCNNFGFHLSWHEALFCLELGQHGAALDLYDHSIRANKTDDYRDIANAASLLQRLQLAGVAVGARWDELADLASRRIEDRCLVFADLHYALALLGAGRERDADGLFRGLASDPASSPDGRTARSVGALVGAALGAFHERRFREAARLLLKARPHMKQLGGSHAQRDLFEQMLIESAVRSGDHDLAQGLLQDRLRSRNGHNRFAAQRLAQIESSRPRSATRLAAALIALAPSAAMH